MSNEEIIAKFKDWKSIRNERASIVYAWCVRRFFRFIRKPATSLNIDDIVHYQSYLKKTHAEASCANEATALRSFLAFTNKRGLTSIDLSEISIPRVSEKIPLYVVQDEFQRLCDIARYTDPIIHLAIRLLWFTAVRVSELCDITFDAIDTANKSGMVKTRKSLRPKQVFWDDETNEIIKGIGKAYPHRVYLFESPRGGKISTRQVERWIHAIVYKAGITKHITPHSFRHGATKEWLNNGLDLPIIKDLLGHNSLMSIEHYTKRLSTDIDEKGREAVRQRVNSLRYNLGKGLRT